MLPVLAVALVAVALVAVAVIAYSLAPSVLASIAFRARRQIPTDDVVKIVNACTPALSVDVRHDEPPSGTGRGVGRLRRLMPIRRRRQPRDPPP